MSSSDRSGISWIIIIAIGVLLGNVLSFLCYSFYSAGKFPLSLNDLQGALPGKTAYSPEQAEAQKKLDGTCAYWNEQVERKDSEQYRAFRDMACARARGLYH